ncbi:hypothetical protein I6L63_15460 [Enterobacter hormaechei]|nr:hypothetical protein [Enterobacter hormaechei]QXB32822.1 hypothetical protein I6L63_15460 [Enterobacter hormaechei]
MSVKITDKKEVWRRIRVGLNELEPVEVVAGIQKGEVNDGVLVAEYATWNEFGTRTTPSRPFMRNAFDKNVETLVRFFYQGRRGIVDGKINQDQLMNAVGVKMVQLIKESILNESWAPNAEYTIDRKKSSKPLVDTGTMLNSITYAIHPYGTSR